MLELDKKAQQNVLYHYAKLVNNLTRGFWAPNDKTDITPEKLLEMAFDEAKVRLKLANLGDKKYRKTKLEDKPQTLSNKITNWFKKDMNKKYRWQR